VLDVTDIIQMDDKKLNAIAGESDIARLERVKLERKVEDLESAHRTCLRAGMYTEKHDLNYEDTES
jgi:hypothetical protein